MKNWKIFTFCADSKDHGRRDHNFNSLFNKQISLEYKFFSISTKNKYFLVFHPLSLLNKNACDKSLSYFNKHLKIIKTLKTAERNQHPKLVASTANSQIVGYLNCQNYYWTFVLQTLINY